MRAIKETIVIISAAREDYTESQNNVRRRRLKSYLTKMQLRDEIRFTPAIGVYKGVSEYSYVVVVQHPDERMVLRSLNLLAEYFEQESILVRNTEGVFLVYMNPANVERIGRDLFRVEFDGPNRPEAYTYFNGQAWVAA